jgi:hypothetical protein
MLRARDPAWRRIAPDFATAVAMAQAGAPFQIVADRRYDRSGDPRKLCAALRVGATVFLPQVHQLLPRLMRLMVALRATVLGPLRDESSFLFVVEGRSRPAMGLHHDGPVDAFWLQLEGRRTVTVGPTVQPGTPADLDSSRVRRPGWVTLELDPGTLLYLPPWTPHDVICRGRSLALSLTWRKARPPGGRVTLAQRRAGLVAWDVASGLVDAMPHASRSRLWTQVPVVAGPARAGGFDLVTPDGVLRLPASARPVAARLASMPSLESPVQPEAGARMTPLLELGILAPHDLPRRIQPAMPRALDGWQFG